ncbi:MAG TPA: alpha/beta fold hydrolase [Chloroflexota bacterium]
MKPIVLVHGMYFGGWCWRKVAARLRAADHVVYTPSLTGCAERVHLSGPSITIDTFGRDVANLLRFEDVHDVTLVATSCGGMAVARAAELEPDRVGRLVLVDALIPFAGQSPAETVPSQWAPTWQAGVVSETDGIAMSQSSLDRMHAEFGSDDGRLLDMYRSTFPRGPMFETADLRRFWQGGWPTTVAWC